MTLLAEWKKRTLLFKFEAGTSRGILKTHQAYYIKLWHKENPLVFGIGEAAPLKGLSIDYRPDFEQFLDGFVRNPSSIYSGIEDFPSIKFAWETAFKDLENRGLHLIYNTDFYHQNKGILINGLVWMADKETMKNQVKSKINEGYTTIKLKIGALDFEEELVLLKEIRKEYSDSDIEIRVDANGAFKANEALEKIKKLSEFDLHSIEQPLKQGQHELMANLCSHTPLHIALDEELIGINGLQQKTQLLNLIKPHYIILKPTLLGGFNACNEWINLCNELNIGWWITSALESNIGLNAIAQYTSTLNVEMPQGLGTGSLYLNNIHSPLIIKQGHLHYDKNMSWETVF